MNGAGWGGPGVTRRGVVLSGGVLATGLAVGSATGPSSLFASLASAAVSAKAFGPVRVERIRRQADMLVANLVVIGMDHVTIGNEQFLKSGTTAGYLGLVLPGQALGENVAGTPTPPVKAELALPTVLGFKVAANTLIPYDVDSLLDLAALTPLYKANGTGRITQIEAPYRLRVQPNPVLGWLSDSSPKTLTVDGDVSTEMWHARLAAPRGYGSDPSLVARSTYKRELRAVESISDGTITPPLEESERDRIVTNAGDPGFVTVRDGIKVVKAPIVVDKFMLSPLGATVDLHGRWSGAALTSWDHRSTWGRDNYVRTVLRGFLAPYRHPCVLVNETVRLLRRYPATSTTQERTEAILVKTTTMVIHDPVADTNLAQWRQSFNPDRGAPFPFRKVRSLTTVLTGISNYGAISVNGGLIKTKVGGEDAAVRLPFVGIDHKDRAIPFDSAVWFVPQDTLEPGQPNYNRWRNWYYETGGVQTIAMPNVDVAVAPEDLQHPGLTTVPLSAMYVGIETIDSEDPPWRPFAEWMDLNLPAISALSSAEDKPIRHTYHLSYTLNEKNAGGVFLKRSGSGGSSGTGLDLDDLPSIDIENTGGLVPMPVYQGLSSKVGSVLADTEAALDELGLGSLPEVASIFGEIKLLGTLTLADIIPTLLSALGPIDDALPAIPGVTHDIRDGRVYVDMDLKFPMEFFRAGPLAFKPSDIPLRIKAHAEAGLGGPAETNVDARLQKVAIEFAGIIAVPIVEMRAQWASGGKPVFTFEIDTTRFLGPLAFLQPIADFFAIGSVESDDESDDPAASGRYLSRAGTMSVAPAVSGTGGGLDAVDAYVDDVGLHLLAEINVPDVKVGVFTLTGLNFGVGVDLPFGGGLQVHAYFASYANPFTVTYSGFGGTGFVDVLIAEGGKQVVKASIGVAATLGIDLFVASGSLSVNVGLIITIENDDSVPGGPQIALTAYFRISGSVSVPFICTVSVLFELELEFRPGLNGKPSQMTGTARFLLKVDTLIYDEEVEARISRTFNGGPSMPSLSAGEDPFEPKTAGGGTTRVAGASQVIEGDFEQQPTFRTTHPTSATWLKYAAAFAKDPG